MGLMGKSPVKEKGRELEKKGDALNHHAGLTRERREERKHLRLLSIKIQADQ